ncbi:spore coat biosynthesis protein F [Leptospira sp. 96542]|nr:spore coat biosynthesis protein F [Leptospira sp. 96542]
MNGIPLIPKTFAFIQARLGSTRLPNKILKEIPVGSNVSILNHIHSRLRNIFPNENIIFLIPNSEPDLAKYLESFGYHYFLGDELNVKERYIKAAEKFGAEHIFRLTGDNPFIDIESLVYLRELIHFLDTKFYCLSIVGLPLGMGVECFSYDSLKSDVYPEEDRHKEHVSLHIKENPNQHRILRIEAPHLTTKEREFSQNIRMTVDEDKDFNLVSAVWEKLNDKKRYFGSKEVIDLYKKEPILFQTNQDVNQVQFELPKQQKSPNTIQIVYGDPTIFGSGHYERCKSLALFLQTKGYSVELNTTPDKNCKLHIVDARENFSDLENSYFIDNLYHKDPKENASFILPHPDVQAETEICSFFPSPLIFDFIETNEVPGKLIVYAGQLDENSSHNLDSWVISEFNKEYPCSEILRVGGTPPESKDLKYIDRLNKVQFLEQMAEAQYVLTYFGQSLLEALYLQKQCFCLGISDVHERLGLFLESKYSVPYLGKIENWKQISKTYPKLKIQLKPDAHMKILNWVNLHL